MGEGAGVNLPLSLTILKSKQEKHTLDGSMIYSDILYYLQMLTHSQLVLYCICSYQETRRQKELI